MVCFLRFPYDTFIAKPENAVLPEWKPPVYDNTHGITLVTATTRRNSPNVRFLVVFVVSWIAYGSLIQHRLTYYIFASQGW